jgi:predicted transcriptional regulator
MTVTKNELAQFQVFAEEKLSHGSAESIEQLVDLWRLANPTDEQAAEDLAAIQRGVADADAGRTVPIEQAFDEVRKAIFDKQ